MRKILLFFLLFPAVAFGQERVLLEGRVEGQGEEIEMYTLGM